MTPSFPTLSIASAMISPIAWSEFAEMVPTWAIDFPSVQGVERPCKPPTADATALSIPRFRSIGLTPAATAFKPSLTTA